MIKTFYPRDTEGLCFTVFPDGDDAVTFSIIGGWETGPHLAPGNLQGRAGRGISLRYDQVLNIGNYLVELALTEMMRARDAEEFEDAQALR